MVEQNQCLATPPNVCILAALDSLHYAALLAKGDTTSCRMTGVPLVYIHPLVSSRLEIFLSTPAYRRDVIRFSKS